MKNLMFLFVLACFLPSCSEDCIVPQVSYEWTTSIDREDRRAIIWRPHNKCINAPVLIYFHGRGGDAEDSQNKRKFHELMKDAYIVYAEGTNFDSNPNGAFGWETRFPHINTICKKDKDIKYLQALLNHLGEDEHVNLDRVGVCGHSSGGFFTLSLAELMPDAFAGFASLGSYSSYNPKPSLIDCTNTYVNGIDKAEAASANAQISKNPAPTLFIFGTKDSTLHGNVSSVYKQDCTKFSYFQNSIQQICRKNGSDVPDCVENDYMNTLQRQIFPANGQSSAETQVQMYDDDHSWPIQANQWIVNYFMDLLYY